MASIEKRKLKGGKHSYRVLIRLKGHPTESESFERLTDAKKWASSTESAIREGRHFKTVEAKKRTISELIQRYIVNVLPEKKSSDQQEQQLLWWEGQIGKKLLIDVTPAVLSECIDKLQRGDGKERSPATVNRYRAALSHAFSIAMNEWQWIESSPMSKIKKRKEPGGRIRYLSDKEREKLLKACKESDCPILYSIVVLAISTGGRKMELLKLTRSDIDLKNSFKKITFMDTKNGERRSAPLSGLAFKEMKSLLAIPRIDTNLLFPSPRNPKEPIEIRKHWDKAIKKAKIKNFVFHDLRHTFGSYLAMNGASLSELADALGHKSFDMVKRYAHLSEQHTASVVASMNKKIFGDS